LPILFVGMKTSATELRYYSLLVLNEIFILTEK